MILLPDPWWPQALLALVVLSDVVMSFKPPAFIYYCLDGVGFPRDWFWGLIAVKFLATVGLIAGLWVPGVGIAANIGVVSYFVCAAIAHVRARFFGQPFWVNWLGMFVLSTGALVWSFVV